MEYSVDITLLSGHGLAIRDRTGQNMAALKYAANCVNYIVDSAASVEEFKHATGV